MGAEQCEVQQRQTKFKKTKCEVIEAKLKKAKYEV